MIPEFDKLTHFYCEICQKLLYRGHWRRHRFRKYHLKNLERINKIKTI